MKSVLITTTLILLCSCKLETREEKAKRIEQDSCSLAHRYISECAYEYKRVKVVPFKSCTKEYADRILEKSCKSLLERLSE